MQGTLPWMCPIFFYLKVALDLKEYAVPGPSQCPFLTIFFSFSVAATSSAAIPGSLAECPASGTICRKQWSEKIRKSWEILLIYQNYICNNDYRNLLDYTCYSGS